MLFFSAVYYYLPSAVYLSIGRLAYYCMGTRKIYVGGLSGGVGEVLRNSREAVVSLKEVAYDGGEVCGMGVRRGVFG